ncbi:proteasome assembly chaperone family protein [Candidatus Woesearchaeota archaeon]|nr:proteasome assembly chaperone family protein [Candidatus Woesearchaeota archaeon]
MKITLKKNAKIKKKPVIIEGFPGFGLVGTIATEFLIDHLKTRLVGEFDFPELPATTAIHDGKVIKPMAVHYSDEYNILLFHTILSVKGHEWEVADEVARIAKEVGAKEIISLEGVNALTASDTKVYSYGSKKLEELGADGMKESVIVGVTAALLLKLDNVICLFAQTAGGLPDSKAAASIIDLLDQYLKLGVDPKPLLKQATEFEQKLKGILEQTKEATTDADKKNLSYLG